MVSKQLFETVMLDITLLVHVVGKHNVTNFFATQRFKSFSESEWKMKKNKHFFCSSYMYFESVIYLLQHRFLRDLYHFCICYIRCGNIQQKHV